MRALRPAIAIGLLALAFIVGWLMMIRMPGDSYQGPFLPLTKEEREIERGLKSHVYTLAGQIGERNLFRYGNLVKAAGYIRETLSGFGYQVKRQTYEVSGQTCENIEVEVRGAHRPDEILLIGAHYDSVRGSPGANDNATGVAAMLALAGAFAQSAPPRTVRFVAFVNEEPPFFQTGHMGSWVYAKRSREREEKIVAMVSLETIGFYSDEPGSQAYPFPLNFIYPSTGDFLAVVSNVRNGPLVRQLLDSFRRRANFPSEGGAIWGLIPGVGWSDHWAFWREGYPAVMLTDTALFRYAAYHTGRDTPEKIEYDRLARVVVGIRQVIGELANTVEMRDSGDSHGAEGDA